MTRQPARRHRGQAAFGLVLVTVPLLLAVAGPWFAGEPGPRGVSFTLGDGHWLGTDFTGRDVWRQILLGGRSVVLTAAAATALAYLIALPVGLAAALTHRVWLEELLMRPLDVVLAIPSLLLLLMTATLLSPSAAGLAVIVALINVPDTTRMVRAAATEAASRPAVEAMRAQGETWWRMAVGYTGRATLRTLTTDAGVRLTGVLYLVATAAFLGVGVTPDAADWAAMVDQNRTGLLVQPWAVVVPALLIIALTTGTNLLFDSGLASTGASARNRTTRKISHARDARDSHHTRDSRDTRAARHGAGVAARSRGADRRP
ncbi:ABC transporter permease subunit [Streptomyces sp. B6B3]|uniref:ABC transporter permease n=1 Tax=Streptomyces sp. B6B3 TaxID=3153570 RepID=UPI00325F69C4